MATIERFEDLNVWKDARILCKKIFEIMQSDGLKHDYRLKDQINGSSGSVMDNISEGFERDGGREFIQFLAIAKGSAGETRSQLHRIYDREYITQEKFEELILLTENINRQINGLMRYLSSSGIKGNKFNEPQNNYKITQKQLSVEENSLSEDESEI